ncbi:hypothetical protein WI604_17785 [Bradyrhizobium symbiodeficiens]|uniref:hypothetical protein n=1 Tax=Bradyrhizobium symbiodeficiens TaxID=1404367 RepID=UPI0030CD2DF8
MAREIKETEVERIFLYEENPRHEPLESQPEIIEHLCKDEQVLNLARSIAEEGPNPLEIVGLVEVPGTGRNKKNFVVWEGNRRICAIKLLNDPDLAPAHFRKDIARLAEDYKAIESVPAVVFDDHEELRFWMGIIHGGQQGGIGRKDWNADQKQRHTGSNRNKIALAVLDVSEKMGLLSKEERSGKLTTAQRHLNSEDVRQALGIDASDLNNIKYTIPIDEFKSQLSTFIGDLKNNDKVNSRNNKTAIDKYGRTLAKSLSGDHSKPTAITKAASSASRKTTRKAPRKAPKIPHIQYHRDLADALATLASGKLERLHYSICDISLEHHAPLLTVGVWAFVESLTALAGRNQSTDFVSFYSNNKISQLGIGGKPNALREALTRIQHNGNTTKHHEIAASFDGEQLANDFDTIAPLLMKTIADIIAHRTP